MLIIPIQPSTLVFVLQKENIDRMAQADPITLEQMTSGGFLPPLEDPADLKIVICYEPIDDDLIAAVKSGVKPLMGYLMRGYQFKESDGKLGKL